MSEKVGEGSVVVAEFGTHVVTLHLARPHVQNNRHQEQNKHRKKDHDYVGQHKLAEGESREGKTKRRRSKYVRD